MAGAPKGNINAKKGLTAKQKRFCLEYLIDLNGSQAAIRSGYSKKTSREIASKLLTKTNIQEEITKLKNKTGEKLEITHEMLTREWQKMAFIDVTDIYKDWMSLEDFTTIKEKRPEILSCIKSINTRVRKIKTSEGILGKAEQIKIEFYSKENALENLGKHIGYYEIDNKQKSDPLMHLLKPFKSVKLKSN